MPSLFIATPTPRHEVGEGYVRSLWKMERDLTSRKITHSAPRSIRGHDIAEQRDLIAHLFLSSGLTHLLCIDSDTDFAPDLYSKLLGFDKPLIGAIYPHRSFDLDRLEQFIARGVPFKQALSGAYRFGVKPLPDGRIERRGDLFGLGGIGMGFALIARSCFEQIAPTCRTYRANYKEDPIVTDFFGRMDLPDSHKETEDFSFCARYLAVGGQVWGYSSSTDFGHIGTMVHRASFADHIESMRQPTIKAAE